MSTDVNEQVEQQQSGMENAGAVVRKGASCHEGRSSPSLQEDERTVATGSSRTSPQAVIQESIKYRRRAQEAERRAGNLEAEVQNLGRAGEQRMATLEAELAQARANADDFRGRLEKAERDRCLERELVKAGCTDAETALALCASDWKAGRRLCRTKKVVRTSWRLQSVCSMKSRICAATHRPLLQNRLRRFRFCHHVPEA